MISSLSGPIAFDKVRPTLLTTPIVIFLAVISLTVISTVGGATTCFAQTRIKARAADRFVDAMGINVHMESTNKPYNEYAAVNRYLRVLGMRHFRDEINQADPLSPYYNPAFVAELLDIGGLGYTLCGLLEGGNDYPIPPGSSRLSASHVVPMVQSLEPVIEAVEGPNEPDDVVPWSCQGKGFCYDGVPYPQGAINESVDLWNIVRDNPEISQLPIVVMSEGSPRDFKTLAARRPPASDYATFGNMHAYQGGGVGDANLSGYMTTARDLTKEDSLWTTEMGYHNNTRYLSDGEQQGVSERASAIYLPIAFLSGFNRGVFRTFSYELLNEAKGPPGDSGEGDYGLLTYDGKPKPAYTTMKNLISLLGEPGGGEFEPASLEVEFSGAPSTMRYTLLQKSTGDFYLAIWNEVSVYRIAYQTASGQKMPGKDLYPQEVPVTVRFFEAHASTVYAPNDATGVEPTDAYTIAITPRSIMVNLPAKVLLVRIAP
jgi:hypothetical protein